MTGYVDAHVHFWDPSVLSYDWLADVGMDRRLALGEYRAATADDPPDRYVFVQAGAADADGVAEAMWVEEMCAPDPAFGGMVVWAPVDRGAGATVAQLETLAADGVTRTVGVRRLIQGDPPALCNRPEFVAGVAALAERDLVFDVCILPRHLGDAVDLARGAATTRLVIDHVAKPAIAGGSSRDRARWRAGIVALAESENVWCKLSGMVTEADHDGWTVDDLRIYVDVVLEAFGAGRVLWGATGRSSASPRPIDGGARPPRSYSANCHPTSNRPYGRATPPRSTASVWHRRREGHERLRGSIRAVGPRDGGPPRASGSRSSRSSSIENSGWSCSTATPTWWRWRSSSAGGPAPSLRT